MFTLTGDIHIIRQNSMCIPYVPKTHISLHFTSFQFCIHLLETVWG